MYTRGRWKKQRFSRKNTVCELFSKKFFWSRYRYKVSRPRFYAEGDTGLTLVLARDTSYYTNPETLLADPEFGIRLT